MTRLLTLILLLNFLFIPVGYAHSDQKGMQGLQQCSLAGLSTDLSFLLQSERAQLHEPAGHGASRADHTARAIEVEEDEDPVTSKHWGNTILPRIGLHLPSGDPFTHTLLSDGLPFCEHLSYSSPKFILLRVIRI